MRSPVRSRACWTGDWCPRILRRAEIWVQFLLQDHRQKLKRLQHPDCGTEFRRVLKDDADLAGIIVEELEELVRAKQEGRLHAKEDKLHGEELSSIAYLRLYKSGYSARVYFATVGGNIWLLAVDGNKRQTKLSKSTEKMLCDRLADVRRIVKEEAQNRGN